MLFVLVILIRRLHWSNFKMQWLYLPIWCVLSTWISSLRTLLTHLYNITTKKTTTIIKQSCARHQVGSYTFTSSAAAPGHFCISHFNNSWQLCDAFKGVIKCSSLTWLHSTPACIHLHVGEDMMAPILCPSNVQLGIRITLFAEARRHPSIYSLHRLKISLQVLERL